MFSTAQESNFAAKISRKPPKNVFVLRDRNIVSGTEPFCHMLFPASSVGPIDKRMNKKYDLRIIVNEILEFLTYWRLFMKTSGYATNLELITILLNFYLSILLHHVSVQDLALTHLEPHYPTCYDMTLTAETKDPKFETCLVLKHVFCQSSVIQYLK